MRVGDTNSIIGSILAVAALIVIPFTFMGQCWRTGGATFSPISCRHGRYRGGSAKIAGSAQRLA
jgi:hypothetical protein